MTRHRTLSIACGLAALMAAPCHAHFLWIKTISAHGKPQAFVFFGESATDEAYHFPEKLAKTTLWGRAPDGKRTELATEGIDTDERVGLIALLADGNAPVLEASQRYGIYGESLLVYHAKHVRGASSNPLNSAGTSKELKLEIVPHATGDDVKLTVLWEGKPLASADVTIAVGDGQPTEKKTGDEGSVNFTFDSGGLVGVLANYLEKDKSGELEGKPYKGVLHYTSLTFNRRPPTVDYKERAKPPLGRELGAERQAAAETSSSISPIPPLPEPMASFGAVVSDGWLYVYGGHQGEEHEHSAANLSKHFRRIRLDGGTGWEELPMQTPLQGLPLVAHNGKIYRIGGLDIRNATTKDAEDLHSTADFAEFDPASGKWTMLAPLPAARSSHNAVVMGDRLYVVGGWRLDGKSPGEWQPDALVYDLAAPTGWQKLPATPFKRRALAGGKWKGKVFAIGGLDEASRPSVRVDVFDPNTGAWTQGPDLPGAGMAGFGVSAWNLNGILYVCGLRGILCRLNDTGSAWEEAGRMATPRFFHQLVPAPNGGLMAVGGASRKGPLASIERIELGNAHAVKNGSTTPPL